MRQEDAVDSLLAPLLLPSRLRTTITHPARAHPALIQAIYKPDTPTDWEA